MTDLREVFYCSVCDRQFAAREACEHLKARYAEWWEKTMAQFVEVKPEPKP